MKSYRAQSQGIDPDLMTVSMLVLTAISTLGTTITTLFALRDKVRRDMPRPQAIQIFDNIEDATRDLRLALGRIVETFEEQQQRTLTNEFLQRPRFGVFAPEFNAEEFQSYQNQISRLEQAAMNLRMWSRNMQTQATKQRFPNENILTEDLSSLIEDSNMAVYDVKNFRDQVKIVNESLERIERAVIGARKSRNL